MKWKRERERESEKRNKTKNERNICFERSVRREEKRKENEKMFNTQINFVDKFCWKAMHWHRLRGYLNEQMLLEKWEVVYTLNDKVYSTLKAIFNNEKKNNNNNNKKEWMGCSSKGIICSLRVTFSFNSTISGSQMFTTCNVQYL